MARFFFDTYWRLAPRYGVTAVGERPTWLMAQPKEKAILVAVFKRMVLWFDR
jgi:hypothetical protein